MDSVLGSDMVDGSVQRSVLSGTVRTEVLSVKPMALTHNVSDTIHIKLEKNKQGYPVIEMEFKFVRYRLVVDDQKKGEKIKKLLDEILDPAAREPSEKMEIPKFYKRDKK
jgi:hypothetical protein